MERFTYKIVHVEIRTEASFSKAENSINELAKDGWRVISVNSFYTNQNTLVHLTYTLGKEVKE